MKCSKHRGRGRNRLHFEYLMDLNINYTPLCLQVRLGEWERGPDGDPVGHERGQGGEHAEEAAQGEGADDAVAPLRDADAAHRML